MATPLPLHAAGGADHLAAAWSADPVVIGGAVVALALFGHGWLRLRRRGRREIATAWRLALFVAGLAVVVLAVLSPLDPMGERYLLSAHMAQHLLLGDIGPLLLVLALSGPLAAFAVPRPLLRRVGRSRPLRAALRGLTHPATAVVVWVSVTAGWHVPLAYEAALDNRAIHDLEHSTMLLAGVLLWVQITGALPRRSLSAPRRAGLAAAMFAVGMVVSQTLFVSGPLYQVYIDQPERLFGLTATADQVTAAMLMMAEQLLTLGVAAGLILWAHFDRAAAARGDAVPLPGPGGPG